MFINSRIVLSNVKRCYPMQEMCWTTQQTWYSTRKIVITEKKDLSTYIIEISKYHFFCISYTFLSCFVLSLLGNFGPRGPKNGLKPDQKVGLPGGTFGLTRYFKKCFQKCKAWKCVCILTIWARWCTLIQLHPPPPMFKNCNIQVHTWQKDSPSVNTITKARNSN